MIDLLIHSMTEFSGRIASLACNRLRNALAVVEWQDGAVGLAAGRRIPSVRAVAARP